MSGNLIGRIFRVVTWGESHGRAVGAVIDGCPPGVEISEEEINRELERRRPKLPFSTSRKEPDKVEILSGVFDGKTLGTPISLLVWNRDVDSAPYEPLKDVFRPGHADIAYFKKFGLRDWRGGGRASARETVARVAAGAVAKKVLKGFGVEVFSFTVELGGIAVENIDLGYVHRDPLFSPDPEASKKMLKVLKDALDKGDTVGGVVEIRVKGLPPGIGDPVFDKLDATLSHALMSIGAVKGVEFGAGFAASRMRGSRCNDPIGRKGFLKNDAGGILGGISTGEELIIRVAVKPVPSIRISQKTINEKGEEVEVVVGGRHDASPIPRINPVCEAMVSIVLVDHILIQKALRGLVWEEEKR